MNQAQLTQQLNQLISDWESEVVEFKRGGDTLTTHEIGKYFSALSNEANLRRVDSAWLVLGVDNKSRTIVGTNYREDAQQLMSLKHHIAQDTEPNSGFRSVHELITVDGRVLLLQIPAAPRGIPIAWKTLHYGRNGESLSGLSLNKQDEIRNQGAAEDWSAVVCQSATIDDLDTKALQTARERLAGKYQTGDAADALLASACLNLSAMQVLEKLKLAYDQKITRAALLLLGKPESALLLAPFVAELSWQLVGPERAYEHFSTPFLLTTSKLYQKIRNLRLSFLPPGQLIPIDVSKYDQKIILEALHNCVAHQDYRLCERILIVEHPTELEFSNAGGFYDGHPDDYVLGTATPRRYRNKTLAAAMAQLGMMDTMGFGIREVMFRGQAKRYLPLPDYVLTDPSHVTLKISGRFMDENYSRALLTHTDFTLSDVFALDKVQKGTTPSDFELAMLRKRGLVEGRKSSLHISASVASATGEQSQYMRTSQQDDEHYKHLILTFIKKFDTASKAQIREMLKKKWPEGYTDSQQNNKIQNLLASLKKDGLLVRERGYRDARWRRSV